MIKNKKEGQLIIISGPSGVGKDSVCKKLKELKENIWISVSSTTREIRENEIEGEDYYFIAKEEFEEKIKNNSFLEYAIVHSNQYYGTLKDKVYEKLNGGVDVILVIDINGALQIKEKVKDAIFIFILPPSMNELKRRLVNRKTESDDKITERFKTAYREINEISKYNYVVVNDNIEDAAKKIDAILISEKCRVDRIMEVDLNTIEEEIHEKLVD